jgi:hypothetical protein
VADARLSAYLILLAPVLARIDGVTDDPADVDMAEAMSLDQLPQAETEAVTHAVAVLEQAHGLVGASALPALAHPDLRPVIDAHLDAVGQVVVEHRDADGEVEGYSSGYSDDIAERLAAEGLGMPSAFPVPAGMTPTFPP